MLTVIDRGLEEAQSLAQREPDDARDGVDHGFRGVVELIVQRHGGHPAYHRVTEDAIVAAGLGPVGYVFAIFHLLTHGFFKACATCVYRWLPSASVSA